MSKSRLRRCRGCGQSVSGRGWCGTCTTHIDLTYRVARDANEARRHCINTAVMLTTREAIAVRGILEKTIGTPTDNDDSDLARAYRVLVNQLRALANISRFTRPRNGKT